MLVDAVQSSPFLTDELTDHLIGRLQSLASLGERELMHKRVDVPSRVKMQNSDALLNIDLIQQAMREKRKIRFRYFHYDAAKQKALNHDGKTYELTPVRLIYSDELYYMIGFRDKWANAGSGHQPFTPYRVDRMLDVAVSEELSLIHIFNRKRKMLSRLVADERNSSGNTFHWYDPEAVSYTHLDVYKRQVS